MLCCENTNTDTTLAVPDLTPSMSQSVLATNGLHALLLAQPCVLCMLPFCWAAWHGNTLVHSQRECIETHKDTRRSGNPLGRFNPHPTIAQCISGCCCSTLTAVCVWYNSFTLPAPFLGGKPRPGKACMTHQQHNVGCVIASQRTLQHMPCGQQSSSSYATYTWCHSLPAAPGSHFFHRMVNPKP